MRRRLAAVLLGAVAVGLVPAAPASADCNAALYILTGRCENACTLVAKAIAGARDASGNVLPPYPMECPA